MSDFIKGLLMTITGFLQIIFFLLFEAFLFAIPVFWAYNFARTEFGLPFVGFFSCMAIVFLIKILRFDIMSLTKNNNGVVVLPKKEDD